MWTALVLGALAAVSGSTRGAPPELSAQAAAPPPEWVAIVMAGGGATTLSFSESAFTRTMPYLDHPQRERAAYGSALFNRTWDAVGPLDQGGLGPRYIEGACAACHPRNGRGGVPDAIAPDRAGAIAFVATSRAGAASAAPDGDRLLTRRVDRREPVVRVSTAWTPLVRTLPDGEAVELRQPVVSWRAGDPASGAAPASDTAVTLRTGPAVFGLGLLEAIPAERIAGAAARRAVAASGIRGRPHWLPAPRDGRRRLGRFGWKADLASLDDVVRHALERDMGIVCPQSAREEPPSRAIGRRPEISQGAFDALVFYMRTLGVPARGVGESGAAASGLIEQGARRFDDARCTACHTPIWTTAAQHPLEPLRGQTIAPFTDLLLHDMGEALAASHSSADVDRREWRTPPLWGIGLTARVIGREEYLHDGRARSLIEAILWHGGEAEDSRRIFERFTSGQRRELLAFLASL